LRSVSFVDDQNASAGLLALIVQLRLEHTPSRIEHGFGHPSLHEFQATHVANIYGLISVYDRSREFVQSVLPSPCRGTVQTLSLPLMAAALGIGDLLLDVSVEMTRFELLSIAGRCRLP
jgi:hypothetical protein